MLMDYNIYLVRIISVTNVSKINFSQVNVSV